MVENLIFVDIYGVVRYWKIKKCMFCMVDIVNWNVNFCFVGIIVDFSVLDNCYKIFFKEFFGFFVMFIIDVKKIDSGNYYCCLFLNCFVVIEECCCYKFILNFMLVSGMF